MFLFSVTELSYLPIGMSFNVSCHSAAVIIPRNIQDLLMTDALLNDFPNRENNLLHVDQFSERQKQFARFPSQ